MSHTQPVLLIDTAEGDLVCETPLPSFVKYIEKSARIPSHYLLKVDAYGDKLAFKYSCKTYVGQFGAERQRLETIFNTTNPIYNGTHPENKLTELKLFKKRNIKRNQLLKIGEWNFYELDYLLK